MPFSLYRIGFMNFHNRQWLLLLIIGIVAVSMNAQSIVEERLSDSTDTKYREDQYYVSLTYNLLTNKPDSFSQNGFSPGIHVGVIRDFPINERRNLAVGLGLGYSGNVLNENLTISKAANGTFNYEVLDRENFTNNNIIYHALEVPFELRWRTSTEKTYAFWRIYSGFKIGYVFAARSRLQADIGEVKVNIIDAFNRWQYGLTLGVGNDKINGYLYYGLNRLFNDSQLLNGNQLDLRVLKIGLILYIL